MGFSNELVNEGRVHLPIQKYISVGAAQLLKLFLFSIHLYAVEKKNQHAFTLKALELNMLVSIRHIGKNRKSCAIFSNVDLKCT